MPDETKVKSTNPYRPPVGETASNNPPFIVKGSEILPARTRRIELSNVHKNGEVSHVETTHGVKEFHNDYYPQNRMMRPSRLGRTAESYAH
jgi:hypothetical protein